MNDRCSFFFNNNQLEVFKIEADRVILQGVPNLKKRISFECHLSFILESITFLNANEKFRSRRSSVQGCIKKKIGEKGAKQIVTCI